MQIFALVHADRPENFLRVILDGIKDSAHGAMPGFRGALDDQQIADLARYARARFASKRPEWQRLEEVVGRLRTERRGALCLLKRPS